MKIFYLRYVETASQDSRCHQDVCSSLGKLSQCLMIMIMMLMMVAIKMVMTTPLGSTPMMMRWKMTMTNLFSLTLAPVTMNAATSKTLPRQFNIFANA